MRFYRNVVLATSISMHELMTIVIYDINNHMFFIEDFKLRSSKDDYINFVWPSLTLLSPLTKGITNLLDLYYSVMECFHLSALYLWPNL